MDATWLASAVSWDWSGSGAAILAAHGWRSSLTRGFSPELRARARADNLILSISSAFTEARERRHQTFLRVIKHFRRPPLWRLG